MVDLLNSVPNYHEFNDFNQFNDFNNLNEFNNLNSSTLLRFLFAATLLTAAACGSPNTPLDAESRHLVDSLAAAGIGLERHRIDSLYEVQKRRDLPVLVDSIKQVRLREIQEQLKSVPK